MKLPTVTLELCMNNCTIHQLNKEKKNIVIRLFLILRMLLHLNI